MPGLDQDAIQYALKTAREYGFRRVRLEMEGDRFQATLGDTVNLEALGNPTPPFAMESATEDLGFVDVTAPVVGYWGDLTPAVGQVVNRGEVIGNVVALGLPNEVLAPADGEIVEVRVRTGEPLQYGQPVAQMRSQP